MCGGGLTPAQCRSGHGAAYTVHSLHTECKRHGRVKLIIISIVIQIFCLKKPTDSAVSWLSIVDKYLYILYSKHMMRQESDT